MCCTRFPLYNMSINVFSNKCHKVDSFQNIMFPDLKVFIVSDNVIEKCLYQFKFREASSSCIIGANK